jgi:hypothetical protein
VWTKLSAGSSLSIEDLRLIGTGNHRALEMTAELDGTACSALSAASQGELHALALALFLARATNEASPFRFAVIDDPVQSMDLVKVHALAGLLAEEAKTRQIVVFTHDDRLPEAIRNLHLSNATIHEVTRAARSTVWLRLATDPVRRYLADARRLLKDQEMPDEARTVAVAVLVRDALDAAAMRAVRRRAYRAGEGPMQVEQQLSDLERTRSRLAAALRVPEDRLGAELGRLSSEGPAVVKAANAGSHRNGSADFGRYWHEGVDEFVESADTLLRKIEAATDGGRP